MQANNLKFTSKLQWHEGMLLSPQHFQYSDNRFDEIISIQSQFQAYCPWGIVSYKFDENLIGQGLISISELKAIFPDGTVVDQTFSKSDNNALELDLKKLNLSAACEFEVFLCISTENNNKYSSTTCHGVQDQNVSDNVIDIPILQPKIFLNPHKCSDNSLGYAVFKISFDGKQFFNLPYVPPCYSVTVYNPIIKQLSAIVLNLRQKALHLVNKNQYTSSVVVNRDNQDILRPVISSLCVLEPLIGLSKIHPERLYENLVYVNSMLLPLSNGVPSSLPSYDPFKPYESISFFLALVEKSVATIQQKYLSIPFHQQDRLFYLHMQPEFFGDYIFLGFRTGSGMTDYQLQQWVEESIIACDEKIELVTTKRITGASRTTLAETDAPDLIPHSGTVLYKIKGHDEFIKIKQNLNIFNAGDTPAKRPLDITLYLKQADK